MSRLSRLSGHLKKDRGSSIGGVFSTPLPVLTGGRAVAAPGGHSHRGRESHQATSTIQNVPAHQLPKVTPPGQPVVFGDDYDLTLPASISANGLMPGRFKLFAVPGRFCGLNTRERDDEQKQMKLGV